MNIKTKIKNDMWRFNYVLPFVKKYQFDEKGKINMLKLVLKAYVDAPFLCMNLDTFKLSELGWHPEVGLEDMFLKTMFSMKKINEEN